MKITATKIVHKGEARIMLVFPYKKEVIENIRKIPGATWSRTRRAWHIPYTHEAFSQLLGMYPDVEYTSKKTIETPTQLLPEFTPTHKGETSVAVIDKSVEQPVNQVRVDIIGRKIILKMPPNQTDILFVRSLRYSRWNKVHYVWEIPNYPGNLDLLKEYFKERITCIETHAIVVDFDSGEKRTVAKSQCLFIKGNNGRLKIIFAFNKPLAKAIEQIPYHRWDPKNQWWTIPWSETWLQKIETMAKQVSLEILYEEEFAKTDGVPRVKSKDLPNYRRCPE